MPVLAVPSPFDFELSTERFRAFGPDVANVWDGGALYRAVRGREVRIAPARDGVRVEPWDAAVEHDVRHLLGLAHDLDGFRALAAGDPVLAPLEHRLRGFRPTLVPDAFEMIVG